jgi:hypothetical protein
MFDRMIQSSWETGGEIMVQLKTHPDDRFKGKVLEIDAEFFTLFHSGDGCGVHWAFKREDVAFCGLVVALPSDGASGEHDPLGARLHPPSSIKNPPPEEESLP